MTTTYPSLPITDETLSTVSALATDWRADRDWRVFENACRIVARANDGDVDPNLVRAELTDSWGGLAIDPQRYSAFWSAATRPKASRRHPERVPFLSFSGWTINDDAASGNRGKPIRTRKIRGARA